VFICIKIIHIEKHQTQYQLLQLYINVKRLSNYSQLRRARIIRYKIYHEVYCILIEDSKIQKKKKRKEAVAERQAYNCRSFCRDQR